MNYSLHRLLGAAAVFAILLTACAARLAPLYDKAIVDGIGQSTQATLALFASVSAGSEPKSFASRADAYNNVIGSLEALALQSRARPIPNVSERVSKLLANRGITIDNDAAPPSAEALDKAAGSVAKMRDTDAKQGLTAFEVQAFKGQTVIFLDQALTYEAYLER